VSSEDGFEIRPAFAGRGRDCERLAGRVHILTTPGEGRL
jgi:hypothetical protein